MENNIKDLIKELKERDIERIKLEIECANMKIGQVEDRLTKEKNKYEIENLEDERTYIKENLEKLNKELVTVDKTPAEQHAKDSVESAIRTYRREIEKYTNALNKNKIEEHIVFAAENNIRSEIDNSIKKGEIKAPKSNKKYLEFINKLMETPEYKKKIDDEIQKIDGERKKIYADRLERSQNRLSKLESSPEEAIKTLIDFRKGSMVQTKANMCQMDITKLFYNQNDGVSYKSNIGERGKLMKVVAQIPPDKYMGEFIPMVEQSVKEVLRKYKVDEKNEKLKNAVENLKQFGTLTLSAFAGMTAGALASELVSQGFDPSTLVGGGLGLVGGSVLGGKLMASRSGKDVWGKILDIDEYIDKEIKNILVKSGYLKENNKKAEQLGQN